MADSPNLGLPFILAAQSQKHVTHNEALRDLDTIVQLNILDRNLATAPATPADGDRYLVAASPTGAWAGQAGKIASFQDGAWMFYAPKEGWIAWIADENVALAYDGAAWTGFSGSSGATTFVALTDTPANYTGSGGKLVKVNAGASALEFADQLPVLGVNAAPDTTNKLSVSSAASLFNHAGNGHQVKVNKNLAADTASFLFQTAFSGRAEMGTTGDDNFHFKVSPDGTTWKEALVVDKTTGALAHLAGARSTFAHDATNAGLNVVPVAGDPSTPSNGDIWYNSTTGKFRKREGGTTTDLAGAGSGEANTASNVNVGGVGIFKQKTGVNLEFRGINAGSTKVTVTNDTVNNEIDIDVAEANLTLGNLGGTIDLGSAKASGTLAAARFPALTGDVTTTAGALGTTIANGAVSLAKMANLAANSILGNNTGAAATPVALTAAQTKTLLAISNTDVSGLGALATASSVSLSTQATGTLQAAQAPAHTGDVTSTAGSLALTIGANAVTNAKAAQMAANTLKGNNTGATANATDLTAAQVTAMLPDFVASGASHARGLVPDPGASAGTTRFLCENNTWAVPAGGGGGTPGGSSGQLQYNNAGAFGGMAGTSWDNTNQALTISGATLTTSNPIENLAQTWNAGAVTFTGWKLNITDTASAAGSLLMDLQVGGASKLSLSKAGEATFKNGANTGWFVNAGGASNGFLQYQNSAGPNYSIQIVGDSTGSAGPAVIRLGSTGSLAFRSATAIQNGVDDTFLTRKAAANLQLGAADAAAPVAQTVSFQSVASGTSNVAGADTTYAASIGTGTGDGGDFIWKTAKAGSAGSAQNALAEAFRVRSEGPVVQVSGGGVTVASLPSAAAMRGAIAIVTDATSIGAYGTVTGGGSLSVPVFSDGTNWKQYATQAGAGSGDALVANPLSQFAATTSAQLAGVLSDETGFQTGAKAVFSSGPTFDAGTATVPAYKLTSGTSLTTAAAGAVEFDGTCFYATAAASSRQVADCEQLITLTSAYTLTSQTAAQKLFNSTTNGALTVQGSTTYFFECCFSLTAMSATSGSFGFAFGGTATLTSQAWWSTAIKAALATAGTAQTTFNTAANTTLVTANTTATGHCRIQGKIRVNAGGTLIPSVSLGVAAAAIVGTDSYFRIWPAGAGTMTNVGNWS